MPIHPTDSPEECEWVAGNSEARMIKKFELLDHDPSQETGERNP